MIFLVKCLAMVLVITVVVDNAVIKIVVIIKPPKIYFFNLKIICIKTIITKNLITVINILILLP